MCNTRRIDSRVFWKEFELGGDDAFDLVSRKCRGSVCLLIRKLYMFRKNTNKNMRKGSKKK